MAVPDDSAIVHATIGKKPRDMTTGVGCGRLRAEVALDLYKHNPRWGELIKHPGQTQWLDGYAIDNVLYKQDVPGQSQAVDFIAQSQSTGAHEQWSPDIPRYSPQDWAQPKGDTFVLPPHNCKLGTSLFCGPATYRSNDPAITSWLLNQLSFIKGKFDFVVSYCVVGGDLFNTGDGTYADPWKYAGSFLSWPDYDAVIGNYIDFVFTFNIQVFLVYVGGAGQVPTSDSQVRVAQRIANIEKSRKEKVFGRSMWNEWYATGGNKQNIRAMARAVRDILGPDALIGLDTPESAVSAPIGEVEDKLPAESNEMHDGSAANLFVPQWDRTQPNPRYAGAKTPRKAISIEPRGPGASSGGNTQNELYLSNDYIMSALDFHNDFIGQVLHTGAGVFGPLKNTQFVQDMTVNIFDYHNMPAIMDAMLAVRAGKIPEDIVPIPVVYPGDDKFKAVGQQLEYDYNRANPPQHLNADSGVWYARTIWDHVNGDETGKKYTLAESIAEHRKEWCAALGIEPDGMIFY